LFRVIGGIELYGEIYEEIKPSEKERITLFWKKLQQVIRMKEDGRINSDKIFPTFSNQYFNREIKLLFKKIGVDAKIVKIDKIDESIKMHKDLPDIIVMRCMLHGMKELNIIKELCDQNITIMNPPMSQIMCFDKWYHYRVLEKNGISIPKTTAVKVYSLDDEISYAMKNKKLTFPIIVKSNCGSRGDTVFKCHNMSEILESAEKINILYPSSKTMILQEWIDHRIKGVISILAIGGKLITAQIKTANKDVDFLLSNYREDTNRSAYEITDGLRKLVESSCRVMGEIEMTRMDILHDGQKYLICEINSPGGFIGFDKYTNLDCGLMIAEYALAKHKNKI
jgi:RimK family alpha-L-glutamate ligase